MMATDVRGSALTAALLVSAIGGAGVLSVAAPRSCDEPCPDDGPDRRCPPACAYCACCGHARPAVAASTPAAVTPPAARSIFERAAAALPSADPRAIDHVPRRALS